MFNAKILADSVSPWGARLTTFELTYPRIIHAEMMTHRVFSRNAASSRAIPAAKMIEQVICNPFTPEQFGANQPGMQAGEALTGQDAIDARWAWECARENAIKRARALAGLGVHKQIVNRLLEPFQWYTVILTATEFSNFYALRNHPDAQPEIQRITALMQEVQAASIPKQLGLGEWHIPLVNDRAELEIEGHDIEAIKKIAVGRCARVSYLTHDGQRDPAKDIELCERLRASGHMSPFEHVATPSPQHWTFEGNFRGWMSYRKQIPFEHDFGAAIQAGEVK